MSRVRIPPKSLVIALGLVLLVGWIGEADGRRRRRARKRRRPRVAQIAPEAATATATAAKAVERGSWAPGVYLDDISYTLRLASLRSLTLSRHHPNTAYLASWDGYVFKTTDGGKSWDESRLIVERRPFFSDAGQRLYFGVHRKNTSPRGHARADMTVQHRAPRGRPIGAGYELLGYDRIDPAKQGRAGAAANVNFGIGLPGKAPRLQATVRRFGKPTAGLNIKQTLLLRGYLPTEVRMVVEHPTKPKVVFACTMYGLFRSDDGGLNWVRTFQGVNTKGRKVFHVAVDPKDSKKVLVATGNGLYVSQDSGDNFIKATAQGVGGGTINWIQFNPHDSRYVFAGTDYGLLRSRDGGDSWRWIYFTTFPAARVVRYIEVDPHDKKTGYIATHDGLFVTDDVLTAGLEGWRRLGGLRFTGMETRKITVNPRQRGHLWALTTMKLPRLMKRGTKPTGGNFVWESIDGGKNWKVIYSGNTGGDMMWYENDRQDPALLWLVWTRSLVRMKRRPPGYTPAQGQISAATARQVQVLVGAETLPTVDQVLMASLRYTGVDPGRQLAYRARARWRALLPRIDIFARWGRVRDLGSSADALYPSLPFRYRGDRVWSGWDAGVFVSWNLAPLVFNLHSTLFGRIERGAYEVRKYLQKAIHRFYGEYRRLRLVMLLKPPRDLRLRLTYRMRLEELASYVDFISGGYLTRYARGDRPDPMETPWFARWEDTGSDFAAKRSLSRKLPLIPGAASGARRRYRSPESPSSPSSRRPDSPTAAPSAPAERRVATPGSRSPLRRLGAGLEEGR